MDVLPTSLKLPPHCLDRPWKGSFGGESRVPVGYGDIAPIVLKPSTANHSLADVVHDLLLLTILSEPHLPHTSLEVELQNSIKDAKQLLDVEVKRLDVTRLTRGEEKHVLFQPRLPPPHATTALRSHDTNLRLILLLRVPPRFLISFCVIAKASHDIPAPWID